MYIRNISFCLFLFFVHPLVAQDQLPTFQLKWNDEKLHAVPLDLQEGKIRFWTAKGEIVHKALDDFHKQDQSILRKWQDALEESPLYEIRQRVEKQDRLKVLFVGNSYSFDLPKVFAQLSTANGKNVYVQQLTIGGCTLAKHAGNKKLLKLIEGSAWDIVVLQEQSQTPAFPDEQRKKVMEPPAKKLVAAIKEANAIPVFFLTWGRRDGDKRNFPKDTFAKMQARLNTGYYETAKTTGCAVVPVGKIWAAQVSAGKGNALYRKDGSHPSKEGTYLAALTFYTSIFGELPRTLQPTKENREFVINLGRISLPAQ